MGDAIPLIQAFGLTAALNQIGFNWTAFFRALGDTRPIAVAGWRWPSPWRPSPCRCCSGASTATRSAWAWPVLVLVAVRGWSTSASCSALAPILRNIVRGAAAGGCAAWRPGAVRLALWGGERTEWQAIARGARRSSAVAAVVTLVSERALLGSSAATCARPARAPAEAGREPPARMLRARAEAPPAPAAPRSPTPPR